MRFGLRETSDVRAIFCKLCVNQKKKIVLMVFCGGKFMLLFESQEVSRILRKEHFAFQRLVNTASHGVHHFLSSPPPLTERDVLVLRKWVVPPKKHR